ncbi:MAG TPA: hypothetical protein VN862_08700 [Candidatus Acidoferrales bacterium]|nr:hypothetical protein [Candidatus Acidoferrales bacterium]
MAIFDFVTATLITGVSNVFLSSPEITILLSGTREDFILRVMRLVGGPAVFGLIFAAIYTAIGIGLLLLKRWARIAEIISVGITAFQAIVGLVCWFWVVDHILLLALSLWIMSYLLKPHVKQAFARGLRPHRPIAS